MSLSDFYKSKTSNRICLHCGDILKGRSDKKFCSDWCRSSFHFERKKLNSTVKRINRILIQNYGILEEVVANEVMVELDKRDLIEMGFNFNFHTHYKQDGKGFMTFFCYDYAFKLSKNTCTICNKKPP